MALGVQNGVPDTSHPAPHNSLIADASVQITGVPHACASISGMPKPSPYEHMDSTSIPRYQVTSCSWPIMFMPCT